MSKHNMHEKVSTSHFLLSRTVSSRQLCTIGKGLYDLNFVEHLAICLSGLPTPLGYAGVADVLM